MIDAAAGGHAVDAPVPAGRGESGACWNGTLARSRFLDALSLLLPAGEDFVVAALAQARASGAGPEDAGALQRFVREERAHQRAHEEYNARLLEQRPAAAAQAERARRSADGLAREARSTRLAFACAFEQLTALLSHELLAHRHLLREADPAGRQARLWRWHAAEELAHCRLPEGLARRAGAGPVLRRTVLVVASALLAADVLRGWRALCRADVAAGACARRMRREQAAFVLASLPSLARLAWHWAGLLVSGAVPVRPHPDAAAA